VTRIVPAAAALGLAGLVAVTAVAGAPLLAGALLVTTVAMAAGWPHLLALPTQRGSTTILALCGSVAVLVVVLTNGEPRLRWLPSVVAMSVLAAFLHQLLRRDMRPRLVESITGVVCGVVVIQLGASWLAVVAADGGRQLVLAATAALAGATVTTVLPASQRVTLPFAMVSGSVVAALVAGVLGGGPSSLDALPAAVLGLVLGAVVAGLTRLAGSLPTTSSRQASVSLGAAVVSAGGAVTYLAARLLS